MPILGIPNLFIVETIDSAKKADTLNKACIAVERQDKLKVYVQVNTSGEEGMSCVCFHKSQEALIWMGIQ